MFAFIKASLPSKATAITTGKVVVGVAAAAAVVYGGVVLVKRYGSNAVIAADVASEQVVGG